MQSLRRSFFTAIIRSTPPEIARCGVSGIGGAGRVLQRWTRQAEKYPFFHVVTG
jgi:cation transporter-like permease